MCTKVQLVFYHSNHQFESQQQHLLWLTCVLICLSAIEGKKHLLTHHLQARYLAGGQEEERVTRVSISKSNRDELPQPLLFLLFFFSTFILMLPLFANWATHTHLQEVSHF